MRKTTFLLIILTLACIEVNAGNKIKYYFNHPVNTAVSTGVNAVYLNSCAADTLVAYINRAKYSLDIAVYDYIQGSFANIATAVNNAYTRGVQVRWIFDSSASNTGISLLNPAINKLGSPTSGTYGIMHNKFMVIDGNSTDPNDAIVWTGSTNWTSNQLNSDYNNIVIMQDSALAHAYIGEFNMMWGGSGIAPVTTSSKFGPKKTDLGKHNFTIDGTHVELYFSPSDGTNGKIQSTISTADKDLYFAMYAFTDNSDASLIMSRKSAGVYVAGIDDSYSNSYTPYTTFTSGLGSTFKVYSGSGLYHNKYMIVDPSDKCSDPQVLTGSHNWSVSADTKNDENTLIIHDGTAANIYYQSFNADFSVVGGSLSTIAGCPTGIHTSPRPESDINIYPNPAKRDFTISYTTASSEPVSIVLYNFIGERIAVIADKQVFPPGDHMFQYTPAAAGMYVLHVIEGSKQTTRQIVVAP